MSAARDRLAEARIAEQQAWTAVSSASTIWNSAADRADAWLGWRRARAERALAEAERACEARREEQRAACEARRAEAAS